MEMDYPKTRMDNFFAKAAGSELADNSMEPITDREYWINEMAKKTAGGGLPTIEEGDDGKVLTVSSGEAVWASGGGGGGGIICECDFDEPQERLTARMKAGELFNAFMQGHHVVLHASTESPLGVSHLCYALVSATHIAEYSFWILAGGQIINFGADSADDYPVISMDQ